MRVDQSAKFWRVVPHYTRFLLLLLLFFGLFVFYFAFSLGGTFQIPNSGVKGLKQTPEAHRD